MKLHKNVSIDRREVCTMAQMFCIYIYTEVIKIIMITCTNTQHTNSNSLIYNKYIELLHRLSTYFLS